MSDLTFKEHFVFEKYKDSVMRNKQNFESLVKDYGVDVSKVYKAIVNYQVKKYGETLSSYDTIIAVSDRAKISVQARNRKKSKRDLRGITTPNSKIERWVEHDR